MPKFIPYDKMSKKQQQEFDKARRRTWDGLNPVTRKPEPLKAYNRKKTQNLKDDSFVSEPF